MTTHAVLPGWYGDGSGTPRWWNGRGWTEFLDDDPPLPLTARASLTAADEDVEVLPRHGVVAPAVSLEHGPLRRGRSTGARHPFPTFAVVSIACTGLVTGLGFWLLGR
ncbi:DUF2510 domain-containing protein [Amnibacterium sp.]|uniref:DUF2510 domain-containing protein n=1 Tax=Amnibacterium sp. TaxID=1872496 RepID=UPI00261947E8|nr:DUF2510 domain-containing protein [Amnibacterium sp.]MCU1471951.1 hypothetical protein [Amnibacterium sp.]